MKKGIFARFLCIFIVFALLLNSSYSIRDDGTVAVAVDIDDFPGLATDPEFSDQITIEKNPTYNGYGVVSTTPDVAAQLESKYGTYELEDDGSRPDPDVEPPGIWDSITGFLEDTLGSVVGTPELEAKTLDTDSTTAQEEEEEEDEPGIGSKVSDFVSSTWDSMFGDEEEEDPTPAETLERDWTDDDLNSMEPDPVEGYGTSNTNAGTGASNLEGGNVRSDPPAPKETTDTDPTADPDTDPTADPTDGTTSTTTTTSTTGTSTSVNDGDDGGYDGPGGDPSNDGASDSFEGDRGSDGWGE